MVGSQVKFDLLRERHYRHFLSCSSYRDAVSRSPGECSSFIWRTQCAIYIGLMRKQKLREKREQNLSKKEKPKDGKGKNAKGLRYWHSRKEVLGDYKLSKKNERIFRRCQRRMKRVQPSSPSSSNLSPAQS